MIFEHIKIVLEPSSSNGNSTNTWVVLTADGESILGTIKWYPPWKRYCYFPHRQTLYDATCLHDIAVFCEQEMRKRKAK